MKIINEFLEYVLEDDDKDFLVKPSVKVIVKNDQGKVLILRRMNDDKGAGMWDLPGGGIENKENQLDACKREVFEETNLKIDNVKKVNTIRLKIPEEGVNSTMNIYFASTIESNVHMKPSTHASNRGKPEHTEYKWVEKQSEMKNLPMLDGLKDAVMKNIENDLQI